MENPIKVDNLGGTTIFGNIQMAEKSPKKIPTFSSQVLDDFQVHLQSAQALAGRSFVSRTAVPVPRTLGKRRRFVGKNWGVCVGSGKIQRC